MGAYLFTHFVGNQRTEDEEQVYFSVSKDGIVWKTLNGIKPVLKSTVGDKGIRDPHILRKHDNSGFYLIATDLCVFNRGLTDDPNCWKICPREGSRNIVIWESDDLVNWSEPWLYDVGIENAGCVWAPETAYDDTRGEYMVFWASSLPDDDYKYQKIYRAFTKDFKSFSKTEVYIERENNNVIDTSILKEGDTYYRFTRNFANAVVDMEYSTSLENDTFKPVVTYSLNGVDGMTIGGFEGPTAFKMHDEEKWCLLLDKCGADAGYRPFVTEDISTGRFISAPEFKFDINFRHGTVIPITDDEYERLIKVF